MIRKASSMGGSTILVAVWAMLVLTAIVLAWARLIEGNMILAAHANRRLDAKAYAESGFQVASNPAIKPNSPFLNQIDKRSEDGYEVRLLGEGGRINLNWLLSDAENPTRMEILNRFLERKGVKLQDRNMLIDCMLDWIDEDDLKRVNGAEGDDTYKPGNRPFKSLEEVASVKGSAPLTSKPDWKEWFTLLSDGPIDLRWADVDTLAAIPGIGELKGGAFLRVRRGSDQIDGTLDDYPFRAIEDATRLLGLGGEQLQAISDAITINDPTYRIESVGKCAGTEVRIDAVIRKGEGRPQILRWREY